VRHSTFFWGTVAGNLQVFVGLLVASWLGAIGAFLSSMLIYWLALHVYEAILEKLSDKEQP